MLIDDHVAHITPAGKTKQYQDTSERLGIFQRLTYRQEEDPTMALNILVSSLQYFTAMKPRKNQFLCILFQKIKNATKISSSKYSKAILII